MKRFNERNPTEMNLLRTLAYGEGIISKEQFLSIANRTMFSRYRTEGYLKQAPNAAKGVFQITEKFCKQYRHQIEPTHRFSGSGSVRHSAGLNAAIQALPKGVTLTTGKQIQTDFERFKNISQYENAIADQREQIKAKLDRAEQAALTDKSAQTLRAYEDIKRLYGQMQNETKCCSTPDLQATFTRDQLQEYINQERGHAPEQTIDRLEALLLTSTDYEITVAIEIVTGSYGSLDIAAKETYSTVTQTPIIYFRA